MVCTYLFVAISNYFRYKPLPKTEFEHSAPDYNNPPTHAGGLIKDNTNTEEVVT